MFSFQSFPARACLVGGALALAMGAAWSAGAPAQFSGGTLVAANGMTLYTFDKDSAGSGKSACNGPCAKLWPPLMATAGDAPAGPYTLITRDDGSLQWAYMGKPLYFYEADKAAGEKKGDGFKEVWHAIAE